MKGWGWAWGWSWSVWWCLNLGLLYLKSALNLLLTNETWVGYRSSKIGNLVHSAKEGPFPLRPLIPHFWKVFRVQNITMGHCLICLVLFSWIFSPIQTASGKSVLGQSFLEQNEIEKKATPCIIWEVTVNFPFLHRTSLVLHIFSKCIANSFASPFVFYMKHWLYRAVSKFTWIQAYWTILSEIYDSWWTVA